MCPLVERAYTVNFVPTKRGEAQTPLWLRNDFGIWNEWRTKSLAALDGGVFYVLFTDVTGFYENIDLHRVGPDVRGLGVDATLHQLLQTMLNRWAIPRGKGIPQGYSGSDILAKLYLDPVDRGMRNAGFRHLRYVDDIRVFCKTSLEAKQALLKLSDLIRTRGLNLQTGKTRIVRATEARQEIDGVSPLIQSITQQIAKELRDISPAARGYGTLKDIERVLERHPEAPPPEILERAFAENFPASGDEFDKTLFHYLLTRLAKVGSRLAVDYCLRTMNLRPEESRYVLRYLGTFASDEAVDGRLLDCLESPEAVYDYQLYEVVKWFFDRGNAPERLLRLCREWVFDRNRPPWLRAYCMAVLGRAADPGDMDLIEAEYGNAASEAERVEVILGLAQLEVGRRNAFMARVKNDGYLVQKAVEYVRKHAGKGSSGTAEVPTGSADP